MDQPVSLSTGKAHLAGRHVWAAIAEWRERPLLHGAPDELEVEGWRDRSAVREVSLG